MDGSNGLLVITGDITIVGNGAIIERVSGAAAFRIFKVDSGARLALEGVTIRGGDAGSDEGGGIYNAGTLELEGVTIADNQAEAGGGIASTGSLTAANSTIQDNTAYDGAGLLVTAPERDTTAGSYSLDDVAVGH